MTTAVAMACPVCAAPLAEAFRAVVLQRHEAIYDHCTACGFLRARAPFWLDEAYADAIAVTDTGLLQRNATIAAQLSRVCAVLGTSSDRWLDYAGGYGVLTRLMRDRGHDFRWIDRFSPNLLAKGFEYTADLGSCRAVTAFEVIEHVEDPRGFVTEALTIAGADTLVFSTQLYEGAAPPRDWWYYAFETGQHIGFFRRDTLAALGRALGLHCHSRRGLHFLSRRPLPTARLDLAVSRFGRLMGSGQLPSLTIPDHDRLVAQLRARG